MNHARCDDLDYINFLIGAQKSFTCTEAARSQPNVDNAPAHDSFNRLLERLPQDTEALWRESRGLMNLAEGVFILDDTTLDKPYAEKVKYVTYHWSGKYHDVVKGINSITLLWSDEKALVPVDFRLYNASVDGMTKNHHFTSMLKTASSRGFTVDQNFRCKSLINHALSIASNNLSVKHVPDLAPAGPCMRLMPNFYAMAVIVMP